MVFEALVSELSSSLCTSASQNLTAVLGCHSLEEAVLLLSVDLLRLVGSLNLCHFLSSLSEKWG